MIGMIYQIAKRCFNKLTDIKVKAAEHIGSAASCIQKTTRLASGFLYTITRARRYLVYKISGHGFV